jgi:hypothetical protein
MDALMAFLAPRKECHKWPKIARAVRENRVNLDFWQLDPPFPQTVPKIRRAEPSIRGYDHPIATGPLEATNSRSKPLSSGV